MAIPKGMRSAIERRVLGKGSSPENAGGAKASLGGGLTLGQGQQDNGRPPPMGRKAPRPSSSPEHAGGSRFKLGGGLTLGQGQQDNGRPPPTGSGTGKGQGSGFGGMARMPGGAKPPGQASASTQIGGFSGRGKQRLSPNNAGNPGSMLNPLKKGGKGPNVKGLSSAP